MDPLAENFTPFVNPQDLENLADFPDSAWLSRFDQHASLQSDSTGLSGPTQRTARNQDSAVDLTVYSDPAYPQLKTEDSFNAYIDDAYGTATPPQLSNTPSPNDNPIFSTVNSPGDFTRSQSRTSSPETSNDSDTWPAISIPRSIDPLKCSIRPPTPRSVNGSASPAHTLSKSKQLAGDEEVAANEKRDSTARLQLTLVLATAVEKPEGLRRAYRRARGDEPTPRRPRGVPIAEIDKTDPTHPQNGGAVVICEGCKEREAKRYNRKKKRNADEEDEWNSYEDDRIIMINEKEFKQWQDVEDDTECSPDAKKVDFAMRITCYCRHQEEKSPVGYRVIFTFTDVDNNLLAQQISDIIQITDDHKNKEIPVEAIPSSLNIPSASLESAPTQYTVPLYNYSPTVYGVYSQPTTPSIPQASNLTHSQSMFFARDGQYSQMANCAFTPQVPQQAGMAFGGPAAPTPASTPQYPTHQRGQSYYNAPTPALMSPTAEQITPQAGYPLHRPHSLDSFPQWNFQFSSQQASYPQIFASQPPSRNPSRPASPSWDQGGRSTKKMRAVPGFMLFEDDEQ